jgi:hypothetical protein
MCGENRRLARSRACVSSHNTHYGNHAARRLSDRVSRHQHDRDRPAAITPLIEQDQTGKCREPEEEMS